MLSKTYVFDNESPPPRSRPQPTAAKNQKKNRQPSKGGAGVKRAAAPTVKRGAPVRTPEAVTKTKVNVKTVRSPVHGRFPLAIVFGALACTLVFMVVIWSFVQINEETIKIEALERQLKTITAEEKELTLALEKKNNLKSIEQYAREKLGMVQLDQLAKKYISIASSDKIELINNNDGEEAGDEGISDKLKGLLEYFQ